MRLIPVIVLFFLPAVSLWAQTKPSAAGTASIAGVVTLRGAPRRNVAVSLTPIKSDGSWDSREAQRMKTDGGGRFQFRSLKAGNYVVAALAPGYVIPGGDDIVNRGKPVALAEGKSLDDLRLELLRGAVIAGRVTDTSGDPVAEEPITLWRLNERNSPVIFELSGMPSAPATDDRGVYRLYGLPAGRYQVSVGQVQREGVVVTLPNRRTFYTITFHPDATNALQAKVIEVGEGDEATGIDINIGRIRKTQELFGRVVDAETDQPMPGKAVGYFRFAGNPIAVSGFATPERRTDDDGAFHLSGLLPGKHSLFVLRSREDEHYSEPVEVEVGDETVTGVEIRMRRGASIGGLVMVEGANDPTAPRQVEQVSLNLLPVSPLRRAPIPGEPIRVNSDGRFMAKGLEPGTHRVLVYGASSRPTLLRAVWSGGSHPDEITLQPGEQATDVRIVIAYGAATIRGQLNFTGGSLPDGSRLLAGVSRAGASSVANPLAVVDPSGQFSIKDLVPGEYDLVLRLLNSGDDPQLAQLVERISKIKLRVSVEANRETQVVIPVDLSRKEGGQQ
jgi:protocatechuate 3,4-dioxygenase beta subunit